MWTGLLLVLAVYAGLTLLAAGCQRSLMYFPDRRVYTPREAGLPSAEVMRYQTEDGLTLSSWFLPLSGAKRTVVVFHGNAGNIAHRAHLASVFHALGCSVMLAEYRGYGGNAGKPSEKGLYADSRAAVTAVAARQDVDPGRLSTTANHLGLARLRRWLLSVLHAR